MALNSELFDGTILSLQVRLNTVVTVNFLYAMLPILIEIRCDWPKMLNAFRRLERFKLFSSLIGLGSAGPRKAWEQRGSRGICL